MKTPPMFLSGHGLKHTVHRQLQKIRCLAADWVHALLPPRHLIFIHIPRTGGSSIWHALAHLAHDAGVPVVDLYQDAEKKFSNSSKAAEAMIDVQKFLRAHTCLIHHHTSYKLDTFFDRPLLYTTIVRDPFDRFISEINHVRNLLKSGYNQSVDIGWDADLLELAAAPDIPLRALVDHASQRTCFTSYYRRWFGDVLLGRDGSGHETEVQNNLDPRFPALVRQSFCLISSFQNLDAAIVDIAHAFGLRRPFRPIGHINRNEQAATKDFAKKDYAPRFADDYLFLSELGFHFSL